MSRTASRSLCVDLGASWLRLYFINGSKRRFLRCKAVRWPLLASRLRRMKLGALDSLVVAPTRVYLPRDRATLKRSLRGLAKRVEVISDVELAHRLAFGDGPGVVVVGGTGSIAFGRDRRGRKARAGGLGPYLGDEGSGFWIGREALRAPLLSRRFPKGLALRLAHHPEQVRAVAALAPRVLRWAEQGNVAARKIREGAARALAEIAKDCGKQLGIPGPLATHGGLFKDAGLRRAFERALRG